MPKKKPNPFAKFAKGKKDDKKDDKKDAKGKKPNPFAPKKGAE